MVLEYFKCVEEVRELLLGQHRCQTRCCKGFNDVVQLDRVNALVKQLLLLAEIVETLAAALLVLHRDDLAFGVAVIETIADTFPKFVQPVVGVIFVELFFCIASSCGAALLIVADALLVFFLLLQFFFSVFFFLDVVGPKIKFENAAIFIWSD